MTAALTIAATPIGNMADASPRLRHALEQADIIAAEDTRRLYRMAAMLEIRVTGRVMSFFDGNEAARTGELRGLLLSGRRVLLVSDAGMPTLSDPGHRLVTMCAAEGIAVTAIPGPSAITSALAVAGFRSDRFTFEGFLPRRAGERARRLAELVSEQRTMVFFESPRRIAAALGDLAAAFGEDRGAVVCRELTKTHEEIARGTLADLRTWASGDVLGEVTLVVEGAALLAAPDPDSWREQVAALVSAGTSTRDAVEQIAREGGISRREVYQAVHGARPASS